MEATLLTPSSLSRVIDAATEKAVLKGQEYFGWRDEPDATLGQEERVARWKAKLNAVYSERFLASLGMISGIVNNGYRVRLVQFSKESGLPFNAEGWIAVAVHGDRGWWVVLHVFPDDLDTTELDDIVDVVSGNTKKNGFIEWDSFRPTKPAEYGALLRASQEPGLDIIDEIARLCE